MQEVIEITFEDISLPCLAEYISRVICQNEVIDFQVQGSSYLSIASFEKKESALIALNRMDDEAIFITFNKACFEALLAENISIRVLKYGRLFDLEILCEKDALFKKNSLDFLEEWAKKTGYILLAKAYYCGYEPTSDEKTRLFSSIKPSP